MKYNKSLLNEAFDALTSDYELKESVDPFDLEFNDYEMVEDMEEATADDTRAYNALNTIINDMFNENLDEGIFSAIGSVIKDKFWNLGAKFVTAILIKMYAGSQGAHIVDMFAKDINEDMAKFITKLGREYTEPYYGRYVNDAKATKAILDLCKDTKCNFVEGTETILDNIKDDYKEENDIHVGVDSYSDNNGISITLNNVTMDYFRNNPTDSELINAVGTLLDRYCKVMNHTNNVNYGHYQTRENAINFIIQKANEENNPQAFITYARLVAEELETAKEVYSEDVEEDAEEINAQELVTEDLDQDLDKKLDAHNVYIDYLRKEIEALDNAIKNEKNDEIKAAKEAHLAELNQALETALPDAVKTGTVEDSAEVTPEADVEQEVPTNEDSEEDIDLDEFFNVK